MLTYFVGSLILLLSCSLALSLYRYRSLEILLRAIFPFCIANSLALLLAYSLANLLSSSVALLLLGILLRAICRLLLCDSLSLFLSCAHAPLLLGNAAPLLFCGPAFCTEEHAEIPVDLESRLLASNLQPAERYRDRTRHSRAR